MFVNGSIKSYFHSILEVAQRMKSTFDCLIIENKKKDCPVFDCSNRSGEDIVVMSNNQTNANLIAVLMLDFQMCSGAQTQCECVDARQGFDVWLRNEIIAHITFTAFICHTFDILLAYKINELISRTKPRKKSKLFSLLLPFMLYFISSRVRV